MADDYNISYSYQVDDPPGHTANVEREGLFAFSGCELIGLADTGTLLLNRANGRQLVVAAEVATALTYCNRFKTLSDHAQYLADTIPQLQGQLEDVKNVLAMVHDGGMLVSASDVVEKLQADSNSDRQLAPTRVCIITCDRPEAVERLLDSMLRSGDLSRHDALLLIDDSRQEINAERNRELVTRFNLSSAKTMSYFGPNEIRGFMAALIEKIPGHEEEVRFLIDRDRWADNETYGLARNLSLLLSVGHRCIVLDDDILCAAVEPPIKNAGVGFGDGNSRELACFSSPEQLMQNAHYRDESPLAGHARCLGMSLPQALGELGIPSLDAGVFKNRNAAFVDTLHKDSPILLTQCGSWGDPGTTGNNWLFHLGKESIQRALDAPGGLDGAFQRRHYWLGRTQANISKMGIMSQATGLDNSVLLPPYFPVMRGEDYVFAAMLVYLHPSSVVLDYPWSVPHLPLHDRSGSLDAPIASGPSLSMCARYIVDHTTFEAGVSTGTRARKLAALMVELSEVSPSDFSARFRKIMLEIQAEQLGLLSGQLKNAPSFGDPEWSAYLQRGVSEVNEALQTPRSVPRVPGLSSDLSEENSALVLQGFIRDFANAFIAWPVVRDAASELAGPILDNHAITGA